MDQLIEDIGNMEPHQVPQLIPREVQMRNPQAYIPQPSVLPPSTLIPLCKIGDTNCYNNKFFIDLFYNSYNSPHKFIMVEGIPLLNVGGFYYKKFGINNNVYIVRSQHPQLQLTPQDQFVIITNKEETTPANNSIQDDVPTTLLTPSVRLMPVPQNFIKKARILPTQDLVMFSKYLKYKNKYYKLKQSS